MPTRPATFVASLALAAATPSATALPGAPIQFRQPEALTSPTTEVRSICVLDATGDGWPDVLSTSTVDDRVVLFPSLGAGTFGPAQTAVTILAPGQVSITKIEAADLNGDGRRDLVLHTDEFGAGPRRSSVSVALATGPGTWGSPLGVIALTDVGLLASAMDYDGDGLQDLVYSVLDFSTSTQEIRFRRGRGDGTFDAPSVLSAGPGTQSGLRGAADFDLDGDLDLLDSPNYGALGYRRNDGPLGLAPRVPVETQFFSRLDPVIRDLDGDGDLDLVHGSEFTSLVFVYRNDGAGGFGPGVALPGTAQPSAAVAAMDVDLDGHTDILTGVLDEDEILIYRGLGGAAFDPPVSLAQGLGARAALLSPVDINGDGIEDLAVGDYFFDDGPSSPTRVVYHPHSRTPSGLLAPVSLTSSAFGATGLTAADLDGDGDDDLLFQPATTGAVTVLDNFGFAERGGFGSAREVEATYALNEALTAGDLDGDGDLDLVTVSGTEDFLFGLFVTENLGPQGLSQPRQLAGGVPAELGLGDFDGDGDLDLVLGTYPGQITVYENAGSLQFTPQSPLSLPGTSPGALVSGDLTGDGVDDLVVLTSSDAPTEGFATLLPGSSTGLSTAIALAQGPSAIHDAAMADFDGDGTIDLALAGESPEGLRLITARPGGSFDPPITFVAATRTQVAAADIDLDGAVDLVAASSVTGTHWLRNLGATSFGAPVPIHGAGAFEVLDVEDDGDPDVATLDWNNGEIWIAENTTRDRLGAQVCGPGIPNSTGASGEIEALGTTIPSANQLILRARSLPRDAAGYFLAARSTGLTFPVPGSEGRLCLTGPIGRLIGPGQVQASGASGTFALSVDTRALPTPVGLVPALAGETWFFQVWHRDQGTQGPTSNFTGAVSITWH